MDQLGINHTRLGETVIVEPVGEVDLNTADQLRTALVGHVGTSSRVVTRLDQVTFLDSTGISALVTAFKAAQNKGAVFCLAAPTSIVAKALQVTGMYQAIPIYEQVERALDATESVTGV